MLKETLSASKIKVLKSCSWQYYCKYILKLPEETNSGALKGSVCHLIFEVLGKDRHKKHYDAILKRGSSLKVKAVKKLINKHVKKFGLSTEDRAEIDMMIIRGLQFDFFGKEFGEPSEVISEKDFDIIVEDNGRKYRVKGFIDKLFLYEHKSLAVIRDFKTNKKKYEGEEISNNLQDYIYTLAIKHLYPKIKNRKMEFIFLKIDDDDRVLSMDGKSDAELKGFEYELSDYQKSIENFSEDSARSNFAADAGYPTDKSFSGCLLCGFAQKKGELKKDGTKKWHCAYKFDFEYWALVDKTGKVLKTSFKKEDLQVSSDVKLVKKNYSGCPRFTKKVFDSSKADNDNSDNFFT